ncbi:hypothetical protein RZA67_15995 [Stenotrophomonas sp. C3(2023)]|uniref:hypothetical protein n=1 Tax=Stenotrophomonas sp. C3(2023) TaxID=3080277 RepID=UPI00293CC4FB|nr:hypothetical protein [Stenotrophomonas sp. C3(2023)]MDV3470225.1 hypothetical protein [Stenotrophomonas sp. C3(2023)]
MSPKSLTALLLPLVMSSSAAAASLEHVDAVGRWLTEKTLQAAREGRPIALLKEKADPAPSDQLITVDSLDAPDEVKAALKARFERAARGVVAVPAGSIPALATLMDQVPRTWRSDAQLRQRLPTPPSDLGNSLLGAARLLGMEPSGARDGLRSSGLTRYFQLDEVGIVEFDEVSGSARAGVCSTFAEANNTEVSGQPAFLQMTADPHGRNRVELYWDRGAKSYSLVAVGDQRHDVHRTAQVLRAIAANVVD